MKVKLRPWLALDFLLIRPAMDSSESMAVRWVSEFIDVRVVVKCLRELFGGRKMEKGLCDRDGSKRSCSTSVFTV